MSKFGKGFGQKLVLNATKNLAGKMIKGRQEKKKPKGGGSHR